MKRRSITLIILALVFAFSARSQQYTSVSSSRNGERTTYKTSYGVSNFNVESRGKFELSDDDKDIKSMSPDGYLEITKTVFGNRRSIVITPGGSGLKYEYYEGRTQVPFEPEGRKWLSEILPELVNSTTIGAESRVARFYKQGGTKRVLDEMSRMESDHVKTHYASVLMGLNIPEKDYASVISRFTDMTDSDHYRTEFLKKNLSRFLQNKEATEAMFMATQRMESDHYKTEVIKEALRSGPATLENVKVILQAMGNMESDHYKSEVLNNLLRQNNLNDAVISEMINATKTIDSDHYRSQVLKRALGKEGLSSASYQRVLESVKDIESDHYKTEVLTDLLRNDMNAEAQSNLINVVTSIESDHYITTVANEMLKRQNLTDDVFQKLLDTMGQHDSDYYVSVFLKTAMQRPNLTKQNIVAVLNAASKMESDHYITDVLTDVAPKIKAMNDTSLKDAYRLAAKKIESDTYYGRAVKAID